MKSFTERSPFAVGAIGISAILLGTYAGLNYDKLLSIVTTKNYSAYFAEAGGLAAGNLVQVSRLGKSRALRWTERGWW